MKSVTKPKNQKNINPFLIAGAIAIVVLFVLLSPKSAYTTYTDSANGFSISIPANAQVIANPNGRENAVAFNLPDKENKIKYSIGVSTFPGILTAEEYNKLLEAYGITLSSYERISENSIKVNELEGKVIVHSWDTDSRRIIQKQALIEGDGKVFVVTLTAAEEAYQKHEKEFATILSTFRQV